MSDMGPIRIILTEHRPAIVDGVPFCNPRCPKYDGKRCEELGRRPSDICEPAVAAVGIEWVLQ